MGVLLLLPMALLAGVSSPRALAKLPPLPALVLLPSVAYPVWVLVMGVRSFWRLTPVLSHKIAGLRLRRCGYSARST